MKVCALGAVLIVSIPVIGTAGQTNTVRLAESGIRRVATSKPMPVYPSDSRARKTGGVAVAAIVSGEDGRVATVSVLEAPDGAIGAAVRDALLKWEIPAMTVTGRPERHGVRGKVTFYFQPAAGRVANPEDLPGGPRPEPAAGPPAAAPGSRAVGAPAPPRPAPGIVQHEDAAAAEIGEAELRQLLSSARPTVLDVREREDFKRGHRAGAVNIPRDELAIRAYIELDRAKPVVIDCSQAETRECRSAANLLLRGPKVARVLIFLP